MKTARRRPTKAKKTPYSTSERQEQDFIGSLAVALRLLRQAAEALAAANESACRLMLSHQPGSDRTNGLLRCGDALSASAFSVKLFADMLECDSPFQAVKASGVWDNDFERGSIAFAEQAQS